MSDKKNNKKNKMMVDGGMGLIFGGGEVFFIMVGVGV